MFGKYDGVTMDYKNILNSFKMRDREGVKPFMVKCHVCDSEASVLINPKKAIQTRKCSWCHNELKFRIMASGIYKVKSVMGIEYVNGTKRNWITRFNGE